MSIKQNEAPLPNLSEYIERFYVYNGKSLPRLNTENFREQLDNLMCYVSACKKYYNITDEDFDVRFIENIARYEVMHRSFKEDNFKLKKMKKYVDELAKLTFSLLINFSPKTEKSGMLEFLFMADCIACLSVNKDPEYFVGKESKDIKINLFTGIELINESLVHFRKEINRLSTKGNRAHWHRKLFIANIAQLIYDFCNKKPSITVNGCFGTMIQETVNLIEGEVEINNRLLKDCIGKIDTTKGHNSSLNN
jgi:hypothetical protein